MGGKEKCSDKNRSSMSGTGTSISVDKNPEFQGQGIFPQFEGKAVPIAITEDSIRKWMEAPPELKLKFLEELGRIRSRMKNPSKSKGEN